MGQTRGYNETVFDDLRVSGGDDDHCRAAGQVATHSVATVWGRGKWRGGECQEARDSTAWCPGLNGRECHGSFSDKGDFQLSLFGYEFDKDHEEIVRDEDEIRVNRDQPENSLILV